MVASTNEIPFPLFFRQYPAAEIRLHPLSLLPYIPNSAAHASLLSPTQNTCRIASRRLQPQNFCQFLPRISCELQVNRMNQTNAKQRQRRVCVCQSNRIYCE